MTQPDFLLCGAGIFGLTAAIELRQRGHSVQILNPGTIPHPLAASTDISKVVRMEYGSDAQYMDMANESIDGWHAWNDLFKETLYHETGFLLLCETPMDAGRQAFEWDSYHLLLEKGHQPERLDAADIARRYPALSKGRFVDGFYHKKAGFAESGRVVEVLAQYARQLGVEVLENVSPSHILEENGQAIGVGTREGRSYFAAQTIVCAGAYTPLLVPDLQPFMRATGHPVFHSAPSRPTLFSSQNLPVFAADISNSGWYGFPVHPKTGVVKIGNHGPGLPLHPELDERIISEREKDGYRDFLRKTFPALADDPIVYTRRCLYCDTLDGHFWIDRHPEIAGLTVAAGGSGHGFKMAPVLGGVIADAAEGKIGQWSGRFRWRDLSETRGNQEQARNIGQAYYYKD